MDLRALQTLAMNAVVQEDEEYNLRYIFRWYSQRFHTPLHVVQSLPLYDILQHYYEVDYEAMEPHERQAEIKRLLTTPDNLRRLRREEDAADADAVEFGREAEAAAAAAVVPVKTEPMVDPILERLKKARAEAGIIGPDVSLPSPKLEEGIHMKFDDLDVEDDTPGFGPPGKPPG